MNWINTFSYQAFIESFCWETKFHFLYQRVVKSFVYTWWGYSLRIQDLAFLLVYNLTSCFRIPNQILVFDGKDIMCNSSLNYKYVFQWRSLHFPPTIIHYCIELDPWMPGTLQTKFKKLENGDYLRKIIDYPFVISLKFVNNLLWFVVKPVTNIVLGVILCS